MTSQEQNFYSLIGPISIGFSNLESQEFSYEEVDEINKKSEIEK